MMGSDIVNLWINGEPYRIEDPLDMLLAIRKHMGEEAYEYCKPFFEDAEME